MALKPHPLTAKAMAAAIRRLGGQARVKDIKRIIFTVDPKLRKSYPDGIKHADIQGRLQSYSSSPDFSLVEAGSKRDLFERVGPKYRSEWRVREDQQHLKSRDAAGSTKLVDAVTFDAIEGAPEFKYHLRRERNATLIQKFKSQSVNTLCAACKFDFEKYYGGLGRGFIEAHHNQPIASRNGGTKTLLSDLIPLCANCHRMIHRCQPMTLETLRNAISVASAKADPEVVEIACESRDAPRRPPDGSWPECT